MTESLLGMWSLEANLAQLFLAELTCGANLAQLFLAELTSRSFSLRS